MSTDTPRIIPADPTDAEAAAEAASFNGPHADLCAAWAGPPEPITSQLARMTGLTAAQVEELEPADFQRLTEGAIGFLKRQRRA